VTSAQCVGKYIKYTHSLAIYAKPRAAGPLPLEQRQKSCGQTYIHTLFDVLMYDSYNK